MMVDGGSGCSWVLEVVGVYACERKAMDLTFLDAVAKQTTCLCPPNTEYQILDIRHSFHYFSGRYYGKVLEFFETFFPTSRSPPPSPSLFVHFFIAHSFPR